MPKRLIFIALFCFYATNLSANHSKNFQIYGDIMQFLPAFVAIYPLATKDWEGVGWLVLSTSSALGATFIIKYSFYGIAKRNESAARISQRPNNGSFEGFPSGHTASAFVAAGFAQKRYGNALGVPTLILATLTGFSRVVAERHTIAQVLGGAILGYVMGYFITQRDLSVHLSVGESRGESRNALGESRANLGESRKDSRTYSVQISYKF